MHFLLTTLKVVYVLTTPVPELLEDDTMEAIRRRAKWENDDYIYIKHILNGIKKFLVSNFNNYKMVDSRPIMKQFNELLRILGQYTQHDLRMDESIFVSSVTDKLPPSWKDFKHSLKHGKEDLSLENNGGSGSNKKPKLECWKCGKTCHFKRDFRSGNKKNNANAGGSVKGSKDQYQDQGDDHFAPIHEKGSVVLEF
nr:hypothetical protein [Tanacetum cinerariifolium]